MTLRTLYRLLPLFRTLPRRTRVALPGGPGPATPERIVRLENIIAYAAHFPRFEFDRTRPDNERMARLRRMMWLAVEGLGRATS